MATVPKLNSNSKRSLTNKASLPRIYLKHHHFLILTWAKRKRQLREIFWMISNHKLQSLLPLILSMLQNQALNLKLSVEALISNSMESSQLSWQTTCLTLIVLHLKRLWSHLIYSSARMYPRKNRRLKILKIYLLQVSLLPKCLLQLLYKVSTLEARLLNRLQLKLQQCRLNKRKNREPK